jgi:DNA-directed RNA polymerase specialized sigma24 family protein
MASGPVAEVTASDATARLGDPSLAARVRAREPATLRLVVQTYLPQILRAARGAGLDPSAAEDVVQATFATFIETASRFEGRSHVRTWLFGILFRKLSEFRRGRARDRTMDSIDDLIERRLTQMAAGASLRRQPTRACTRGRFGSGCPRTGASCEGVSRRQFLRI